jgi:DNA-binding NtrC family response regulator
MGVKLFANKGANLKIFHLDDNPFDRARFAEVINRGSPDGRVLDLTSCSELSEALSQLRQATFDICVIDLNLGQGQTEDYIEVIHRIRQAHRGLIFVCSSHDDSNTLKQVIRAGADDFISKAEQDGTWVERILDLTQLRETSEQISFSDEQLSLIPSLRELQGGTVLSIHRQVRAAMSSPIKSILVTGPSGTGKETVADIVASLMPPSAPMVRVNCGAIAPATLHAELFGYRRGAFTGASRDHQGFFEQACGGWLYLDEVALLSADAQIALLRVLENYEIRPLGLEKPRKINLRLIAATNESLTDLVQKGEFRLDLYQRLKEFQINIPPLRDRKKEIPQIISGLINARCGKAAMRLSPTVLQYLCDQNWQQGNVRELRNALRSLSAYAVNQLISPYSLGQWLSSQENTEFIEPLGATVGRTSDDSQLITEQPETISLIISDNMNFEQLCCRLLMAYVRRCKQRDHLSLRKIAVRLGISRVTLSNRIRTVIKEAPEDYSDARKWLRG